MKAKKPNFLIVGAAKSGSTSIYHYLNQHPEVFMPIKKEPNFLVSDYQLKTSVLCPTYKIDRSRMVFNKENYFKLFEPANSTQKAIGEASVTYLYKPDFSIPQIKSILGEPKIIIILRDPIKRAFSQYSYVCELGFETETFIDAVSMEEKRLKNDWSSTFAYLDQGKYYNQVKQFLNEFKNVHVLFFEEFIKDKQGHMKEIYRFLEINDSFVNSFDEEYNVSGIPRFKALQKILVLKNPLKTFMIKALSLIFSKNKLKAIARKARRMNQGDKLVMTDEEKEYVKGIYDKEVKQLESMLKVKLNFWEI